MSAMASVLFVHNGTAVSGSMKSLVYTIEICKSIGYSCSVACLKSDQTNPAFRRAGAEVILLDSLPPYSISPSFTKRISQSRFRRERESSKSYYAYWKTILRRYGPFDIVFINSVVLSDLICPSKRSGCIVIQVVRETVQKGPHFRLLGALLEEADGVLFISNYDRELFSLDETDTTVRVIPNPEDPLLFSCRPGERSALRNELEIRKDDIVIIYTGGDMYNKGGDILLGSMLKLDPYHSYVTIYAGRQNRIDSITLAHRLKSTLGSILRSQYFYHDRIATLTRRINRKDYLRVIRIGLTTKISKYYNIADICVVPYRVPHQARPIFEAGMARLPCIVSDFACFTEELEHGLNGYLISHTDRYAWADAIQELAQDRKMRLHMGRQNYIRALKRHDISRISVELGDFIEKV